MIDTVLAIPPFNVRLRSGFESVRHHLDVYYRGYARREPGAFVDFDVEVRPAYVLRQWLRPQARFLLDGQEPFLPLPADQAGPMFEWGLNWCVAQRALGYLVFHAAVLARDGQALVLPGIPGAGKSTLTAALTLLDGWRLLSDELAILDPASVTLQPHPRPISLKNESIDIVAAFPGARLGPVYRDTRKGTISHVACPDDSVAAGQQAVPARWVVFPHFEAGVAPAIEQIDRIEAFALIAEQSFNRERMGEPGFDAMCKLLGACRCFDIGYGSTEQALQSIRAVCGS